MEAQAEYVTTEPKFTQLEVLNALADVIAKKNQRAGLIEMLYTDHLALQMTKDAFKNLKTNSER